MNGVSNQTTTSLSLNIAATDMALSNVQGRTINPTAGQQWWDTVASFTDPNPDASAEE